ncbi:MAG TPA: DUF6629 family protein [Candidatus Babeliales bacterium]|nr:DUF6629 family protein [Candidatus Babeliales bacterium]
MCFSAEASFTASIALVAISWASYQRINKPKQLLLLGVPLGFALQQFLEGLVWLVFKYNFNPIISKLAIYGFLFFAYIFWPVYIPLVLTKLERITKNRKILTGLAVLGSLVSASLVIMLSVGGATAEIANCHIIYQLGVNWLDFNLALSAVLLYVLATVGAMLSSSLRGMRILGIATLGAFIAAQYFYYAAAVSVWCFCAAVLSLLIYWIIGLNRA